MYVAGILIAALGFSEEAVFPGGHIFHVLEDVVDGDGIRLADQSEAAPGAFLRHQESRQRQLLEELAQVIPGCADGIGNRSGAAIRIGSDLRQCDHGADGVDAGLGNHGNLNSPVGDLSRNHM